MMTREQKRQERRLTRAIAEIENEISTLDEKIAHFQNELENPDYADDHVKLMEIQAEIDTLTNEHDVKAENWLVLQEELEIFIINNEHLSFSDSCIFEQDLVTLLVILRQKLLQPSNL